MVRLFLAVIIVGFTALPVSAQQSWWGWPHSSTAQESWLRGWGAAAQGFGQWMDSLGRYENMHESARQKYLQNEAERIRTRWAIQDEAKERRKAKYPDYYTRELERLDREEKRLEITARQHALEKKKQEMVDNGELPSPPKYTYDGVEYENYAEFKKSDAYKHRQQELAARRVLAEMKYKLEKLEEEKRQQEAAEWLRDWYSKSSGQRMIESERRKRERNLRKIMGEEWWQKYYGDGK
jgi:hypothetical protein